MSSPQMYVPAYWPMYVYGQTHHGGYYYPPQLFSHISGNPRDQYTVAPSVAASVPDAVVCTPTVNRRVRLGFTRDKSRWALIRPLTPLFPSDGEFRVLPLANPSSICYFNCILQVLLPFTGFSQRYLAASEALGEWHRIFSRLFRHFSANPPGVSRVPPTGGAYISRRPRSKAPCVLEICPELAEALARDIGPVGEQQDVGEAMMLLLEKLHGEKHWGVGVEEDSVIYRVFRGVKIVEEELPLGERRMTEEMFLTLALAPSGRRQSLEELLRVTFKEKLKKLPPVLCVELSRHNIENKETANQAAVGFPERLTIPMTCWTKEAQRVTDEYELYGVVVRSGLYSNSGHYWAAQRGPLGDWHWINDDVITKIANFESIMQEASSTWSLLLYALPDARVNFAPSSS